MKKALLMKFSPLNMLDEECLEKINPSKKKIYIPVNIHESFFLISFNIFLKKTIEPAKNNQNIIGMFLIKGPKLPTHSVK